MCTQKDQLFPLSSLLAFNLGVDGAKLGAVPPG